MSFIKLINTLHLQNLATLAPLASLCVGQRPKVRRGPLQVKTLQTHDGPHHANRVQAIEESIAQRHNVQGNVAGLG